MRCIETEQSDYTYGCVRWINNNMRCIETWKITVNIAGMHLINNNMRCIETQMQTNFQHPHF